ncbi:kinase-like domain-containing protein [Xylariaceae sp. FL1272]|nr:kinase-like domain-containing protein [Xylariaceae sp. FL1272]
MQEAQSSSHQSSDYEPSVGDSIQFNDLQLTIQDTLGEGGYTRVDKVVASEGKKEGRIYAYKTLIACKVRHFRAEDWKRQRQYTKENVDFLSKNKSPHIVHVIPSQKGALTYLMPLFSMNLMEFRSKDHAKSKSTVTTILHQLLQGIDYLAVAGMGHGEIEPSNVLVNVPDGDISRAKFVLADFGLFETMSFNHAQAGPSHFQPPERSMGWGERTHKVDVWSIFICILWCESSRFRNRMYSIESRLHAVFYFYVQDCTGDRDSAVANRFRCMSIHDPDHRPSAAQLLCTFFNGEGLTTAKNQIVPYDPKIYSGYTGSFVFEPGDSGYTLEKVERRRHTSRETLGIDKTELSMTQLHRFLRNYPGDLQPLLDVVTKEIGRRERQIEKAEPATKKRRRNE